MLKINGHGGSSHPRDAQKAKLRTEDPAGAGDPLGAEHPVGAEDPIGAGHEPDLAHCRDAQSHLRARAMSGLLSSPRCTSASQSPLLL